MPKTIKSVKRERRNFAKIPEIMEVPNLIEIQKSSYEKFLQRDVPPEARVDEGLQGVFKSVFPISDFSNTCSLEFVSYSFGEPKYSVKECHQRGMTYAAALKVVVRLIVWVKNKEQMTRSIRDIKEQEIYLGEIPLMTENGTFIINGTERAIVSQMHRSPGVFFGHDKGKTYSGQKIIYTARIIPYRGSWVEFTTDVNDVMYVYIDRKKKFPVTMLLRAIGFPSNEEVVDLFSLGMDVKITIDQFPKLEGQMLGADVIDKKTGEVVAEQGRDITEDLLEECLSLGIDTIKIID